MRKVLAKSILVAGLLCATNAVFAERVFSDFPQFGNLKRTLIKNLGGDRLDVIYYDNREKLPALVVIPGSLCAPIFAAIGADHNSETFATVPLFSDEHRKKLNSHVVFLERRNIISLETMSSAPEFTIEQIFKLSPCTDKNGGITLEQRIEDTLVQVRWLQQQDWVTSVHLIGISEGSDVAAGVAAAESSLISSLMVVGGAGPSQFSDFAAFARKANDIDKLKEAFSELDQFLSSSPPTMYKGYHSRRWQSFAIKNSSLDLLAKSIVPLFIAHGAQDDSVPIASADMAAIELMRKQPNRPIFYWSVIDGDHMLRTSSGNRFDEIVLKYLDWATSNPSGRKFRAD